MARLSREKKAKDENIMLQKLKDAGATDATLQQVNAAIKRRAEAGVSARFLDRVGPLRLPERAAEL